MRLPDWTDPCGFMNLTGYLFGRAAAEPGRAAGREGHNLYRGASTWDVRIGKRQQDALVSGRNRRDFCP